MLQIGEVQQAPALLLGGVGRLEVLHQGEEAPHGGVYRPQVGQQVPARVPEALLQLGHPLFAGVAPGLDLLGLLLRIGAKRIQMFAVFGPVSYTHLTLPTNSRV